MENQAFIAVGIYLGAVAFISAWVAFMPVWLAFAMVQPPARPMPYRYISRLKG